jgi:hypothetical protein
MRMQHMSMQRAEVQWRSPKNLLDRRRRPGHLDEGAGHVPLKGAATP